MEVLAGVIIGILVTILLLKRPITLNINTKHEEVIHTIQMPELDKELKKSPNELDRVYKDEMKGLIDDINSVMLGGGSYGKDNK